MIRCSSVGPGWHLRPGGSRRTGTRSLGLNEVTARHPDGQAPRRHVIRRRVNFACSTVAYRSGVSIPGYIEPARLPEVCVPPRLRHVMQCGDHAGDSVSAAGDLVSGPRMACYDSSVAR